MSPPKMGRPPADELRKRIIKLRKAGKTQEEIARAIRRSREAVAYHLRQAGLARQAYRETAPIKSGKRRCAVCKEPRPIGSFPSPRDAVCRRCYRQREKS